MYCSVPETGLLLGICPTTIRRWDKKGLIKCFRTLGNHRRIHIDEIQRMVAIPMKHEDFPLGRQVFALGVLIICINLHSIF